MRPFDGGEGLSNLTLHSQDARECFGANPAQCRLKFVTLRHGRRIRGKVKEDMGFDEGAPIPFFRLNYQH